ncbi:MAG: hypothetical protein Q7R52_05400 [archaeon]|nr:hypothetical protein [archaeon]
MEDNRLALVTLYTVPKNCSGREECSGVITADGRLIKQNLELIVVNIKMKSNPFDLIRGSGQLLYHVSFYDSRSIFDITKEVAEKFEGTHSRRTNVEYDDASFRILDRDRIIEYLHQLAYAKPTPEK